MTICHECRADSSSEGGEIIYSGPSPDEIAIISAARNIGYKFLGREGNSFKIRVNKKLLKDLVFLRSNEFDSDRKRMSVIVRDRGLIKLYMKGADRSIMEKLDCMSEQPFK